MAIDLSTYGALKEAMGADFMPELIDTYIADTTEGIAALRQALDAGDAATFGRVAHSIKSTSASLGALDLSRSARELEMAGKSGDLSGVGPRLDALASEYQGVRVRLEVLRNEP